MGASVSPTGPLKETHRAEIGSASLISPIQIEVAVVVGAMAGGAFSLAALPVSTRGLAVASSSTTIYPSSSSASLAAALARSSFNVALIGRGRVLRAFGTSSSELRASSRVIGFSSGTALGAVSLRNLVWVGQKAKKKTGAGSSSSSPVFVAAAVATAVEEAAAAPTVTTDALPRPKKIGKGIVRLRLTRLGRKKRPFFRIVATHSSWRRDGKYIELLGHYNPLHAKDDLGIVVKADRIKYWLGVGAQPSDTVTGILHKVGILKKLEEEQ